MTNLKYIDPFSHINNIFNDPFFLGFNNQFVRWESNKKTTSSFPPYNVKKIDEDNYVIELAVAGYNRDQLIISINKDTLTIESDKEDDGFERLKNQEIDFLHKGIAGRNFTQHFTLGEYMKVKSASLENGMLIVNVEREVPEEAKPKYIKIK
jgi:molecular chaperone IbpA